MTNDEALRLALEALEDLGNHDRVCPQWPTYAEPENYPKCNCGYDEAITAIKAALEVKDEPDHSDELTIAYMSGLHRGKELEQRTWVGLTNEEVADIERNSITRRQAIRAIEAKLKEKNHA